MGRVHAVETRKPLGLSRASVRSGGWTLTPRPQTRRRQGSGQTTSPCRPDTGRAG
jgi:hypothetical protein